MIRQCSTVRRSLAERAVLHTVVMLAASAGCASCRSRSEKHKDAVEKRGQLDASVTGIGKDAKHPYAVINVDDSRFAIVTPDRGLVARPSIRDAKDVTIDDLNGILIWRDAAELHALELQTGRELWNRRFDDHVSGVRLGAGRIAVAHGAGVTILELATARELYQRPSSESRVLHHYDGLGFLFADANAIWLVGDDLGEHWSHALGADRGTVIPASNLVVAIRRTGAYAAIDPSNGAEVAHGTCTNGKTPSVSLWRHRPGSAPPDAVRICADAPKDGELLAVDEGHNEFYVVGSYTDPHAKLQLVARDAVGRIRWTATWPDLNRSIEYADSNGRGVAAFVRATGAILAYDIDAGRLLFSRDLGAGERYAGFTGDCLLIATQRSAVCLDVRTGGTRWTTETYGRSSAVWPLDDGSSLVADGNPLAVSKLDASGARAWQLALPGDQILKLPQKKTEWPVLTSGAAEGGAQTDASWALSPAMGIQIDGRTIRLIDFRTGDLRDIRL